MANEAEDGFPEDVLRLSAPTEEQLRGFREFIRKQLVRAPYEMIVIPMEEYEAKNVIIQEEISRRQAERDAVRAARPQPSSGDLRDPRFVAIREALAGWRTIDGDAVDDADVLGVLDAIRTKT